MSYSLRRTSERTRPVTLAAAVVLAAIAPGLAAAPIHIASATYGEACGARAGNLTRDAASYCDNRDTCAYVVPDVADAAPAACHQKGFVMEWQCGNAESHVARVNGDAGNGSTLVISCVMYGGAGH
ncbi:hypothetical protein [Paraburkholderia rhizosphaerae]|uniref:Uncharacterized protein n=1 Tax=Paraburkholderia rhizosphaerae TaxID=480658 RepID=A0A4R8LZM1_9BURK|nr:hypothetical protein [Paraburkholderia rhizosphaerae]TDY52329.1 hypothetical protein BX592_105213 [Paraburkholderia rhizosphaerae]